NYPYQDIIDYLMRCRFVVSNSYHLLYWAALLGKPTAVYPSINSSKWGSPIIANLREGCMSRII
ncbi:MAG: hypothetical protein K9M96_17780, partial [Deltaproteobacteria bacterium]|nr:hypothetical protein [Deltaproteobacteria bacterium]